MKKIILFLIMVSTSMLFAQRVDIRGLDPSGDQKLVRVDANGYVILSPGAGLDSVRIDVDSLRYVLDARLALLGIKIDTTNARLSRIEGNQTDGTQKAKVVDSSGNTLFEGSYPGLTKPYLYYSAVRDSIVGADTSSRNFNNDFLKSRISIYNSNVSVADTLVFEHYSLAKEGWTNQAIGFRDILTDYLEVDNTLIIVAASTTKTFEVNMFRPGNVRIRPKTIGGRTTAKKCYISFVGIN